MTVVDDGRLQRPLPPYLKTVLATMFAAYPKVIVKHEFSEGFSGSSVFLVRPIQRNGRPELPSVVKIDEYDRIEKEWNAYKTCIQNKLPNVAVIDGNPTYPHGSLYGGLRYPLAGSGAFEVESLQAYCQHASTEKIRYAFERLFTSLDSLWEQKDVHAELHLAAAYDLSLPPNLVLEWTESRPDHYLRPQTFRRHARSLHVGDTVQLSDFQVMRVWRKSHQIELNIPQSSSSYMIRCQSVPDIAAYQVGQIIYQPIACRVKQTRMGALHALAAKALGENAELTAKSIPSSSRNPLPNPLTALPKLLNQSFDAYTSCIHADLHLGNVLVEPKSGNIHLIDFVNAGEFHLLRDFLNLEMAVVTRVLPPDLSDPEQIIPFYETLHCALNGAGTVALPAGLERPFSILLSIRQAAQKYFFKQNEWREYYSGLIIYLLGSLRYGDLDGINGAKRTAFLGAATALSLLENEPECEEPPAVQTSRSSSNEESIPPQSIIYGDIIHGDKIGGDKIIGDKIIGNKISGIQTTNYEYSPKHRGTFRKILTTYFSNSELNNIYFDLGIDYENFSGSGKIDKARELILHMEKRGRISELIRDCHESRPNAPWWWAH